MERPYWEYRTGEKAPDDGRTAYVIYRDDERGLYYYQWVGDDLNMDFKYPDNVYEGGDGEDASKHLKH